ncbi:RNA polymerase sigma factor, sigma-70 family [Pedobacter westerhofensis]|uniref:RNA polymerase sigma factor, sigma-70 family n=1 Tax=Pedobacter westerhofensis TaxID=425512 RepID=A0A521FSD3_9SPHI|nr:sigma-70 family RNA polymerase sigma factor [Pedobacter westerhofensis]SMO99036.1 RNA polymerase sigma factor, sigma-70 family [Pedobacter westerhofensis]
MKRQGNASGLWLSFTKGDRDAFTAIYNTYVGALYEYGMRILKDENQVGDCIHDLFIKLWLNHKTVRKTDNIRFYLIASLRNTILSYKAKEDRLPKEEFHNPDDFVLDFNAESAQVNKEESVAQSRRINDALDQLTGRQKEIIYLKYFEEMSYEQIADLMNISVKGAYKLSARALDALKIIMNADKAVVIWMLIHYKSQIF